MNSRAINSSIQADESEAQLLDKDWYSFLQGFFVILFALITLFLLYFNSPLTRLSVEVASIDIPAIAILIALQTIALAVPRSFCTRFASKKVLIATRAVAVLGLCVAPFALLFDSLALLSLPIQAIGITASSLLWVLCLSKYKHLTLAFIIAIALTFAACITGSISALSLPSEWVMLIQCVCGIASLSLLAPKYDKTLFDMLSVSAEESQKRALTIKIDRWTYSLIGIDFGFAIGSTLLSDTFNFDWALSVLPGDGGGMPTFLVGTIALAGIILFLMRPHFDYTLENVTKRYFTLSVSFCVLTMIVAKPPVQYACLALLLVIVIIQLAIVVSAGVEFIDFDELSPVWYLAEEAFVSGGIALGIIIGGCISNFEVSGASLFPSCCIILTLINIFMQPKIDKGAYPSSKSIDDVLKGSSEKSTPPPPSNSLRTLSVPSESKFPSIDTPNDSTETLAHDDLAESAWEAKIDYIAEKYELTRRQKEIFGYLAKGRDAKFLENHLCISYSTAKSHIYSIYIKLDIHSRQEIIDLIESIEIPEK